MPLSAFSDNPFATRSDVADAVDALFTPLLPFFSESGAHVSLSANAAHFDQAAAALEGFARPLWGIAPLVAGGRKFPHWQLFREGLANGTNPDHPDYWGAITGIDQRQVELAAIGFALRLARTELWDPLDATAKANIAAYMLNAREHDFVNSNWKFFRVLIDLGLIHCDIDVDPAKRETYLNDIEHFYLGNGWYRDGNTRAADHYIPFAFHFYSLVYAELSGDDKRAGLYHQRAATFAETFKHWYAPDGSALPFGRSLTYRFAHAGFWGALAFAGVEALPWGEIKGYYLRNLRWWARQPIFDRDGVLSIGYAYPNLMLSEGYNSAGSPYWAMKAFLPLALPESHPFWAAEESEPERIAVPVSLPEPGMVIQHLSDHVVALSSGQQSREWRGMIEKYGKFAYSTRYGFSVEADDRHFDKSASDNMLSFSDDGMHLRMREINETVAIDGDRLYAKWHPYDDVTVETYIVPIGDWHIRLHEVTTPRRMEVLEGGFAISKPEFNAWDQTITDTRADVRTASDFSAIVGWDSRTPRIISPFSNTNVMAPRTLVPQLRGALQQGTTLLATAVYAGVVRDGASIPPVPACPDIADLRRSSIKNSRKVPVFELG